MPSTLAENTGFNSSLKAFIVEEMATAIKQGYIAHNPYGHFTLSEVGAWYWTIVLEVPFAGQSQSSTIVLGDLPLST